jgi:hypothetical protein
MDLTEQFPRPEVVRQQEIEKLATAVPNDLSGRRRAHRIVIIGIGGFKQNRSLAIDLVNATLSLG